MSLIENAWYAGGRVAELEGGLFSRIILGKPVVFFKTAQGDVSALLDVCPHRAVPLHLGKVIGDRIQCAYHGLEFDKAGVCRHNPHIKGPSERLTVRAFPVEIRDRLIWIWPGNPDLADRSQIPDYSMFDMPTQFTTADGYTRIDADYRLVIDNLLDLSHADYIHLNTVGTPGAALKIRHELEREKGRVTSKYFLPDMPPSAFFRKLWDRSSTVDTYADMTWSAVGNLFLDVGVMAPGAPREQGLRTPTAHIVTPETARSTHYFWSFARGFDLDNPELTAAIRAGGAMAFNEEDKPMIEAAQRMLDLTGAPLRSFSGGDAAAKHVRHILSVLGDESKPERV